MIHEPKNIGLVVGYSEDMISISIKGLYLASKIHEYLAQNSRPEGKLDIAYLVQILLEIQNSSVA